MLHRRRMRLVVAGHEGLLEGQVWAMVSQKHQLVRLHFSGFGVILAPAMCHTYQYKECTSEVALVD